MARFSLDVSDEGVRHRLKSMLLRDAFTLYLDREDERCAFASAM